MENIQEQREEEFESIYFSEMGMCGCGRPEEIKQFLYSLLKNHKAYDEDKISYKEMDANRKKIITETDPDVIFEFIFHVMDHNDLVEHGSSIYGSWFTEKGKKFFDLLEENLHQ